MVRPLGSSQFGSAFSVASAPVVGGMAKGYPFSVVIDENGDGAFPLEHADTYSVTGLAIEGEPSLTYSAPYRLPAEDDEDNINIHIDNFDPADEGLVVTGSFCPTPESPATPLSAGGSPTTPTTESITLAAAAVTFAVNTDSIELAGDAGGNSITSITTTAARQYLLINFLDSNVSIIDGGNLKLSGNVAGTADDTLLLFFNGTVWRRVGGSAN